MPINDLFTGEPIEESGGKSIGRHNVFVTLGASNHAVSDRDESDFYATDPIAAEHLCSIIDLHHRIWEPACGQGHLAEVFKRHGHEVRATDLVNRGYGEIGVNFLACDEKWHGDIITNPPFKFAVEFCEKALELATPGNYVCMFLRLSFLEGKSRYGLFKSHPLKFVYVASQRITCAKNGDFKTMLENGGGAQAYAWFIWQVGYDGETILRFLKPNF